MPVRIDRTEQTEKALANVYLSLYDDIQNDPDFPNNTYNLRKKYNNLVYTSTRKAIEEVYKDGMNYVARKTKIDTYITNTDLDNIKKLTDKGVNSFWKRIEADAQRKKDNDVIATFMPNLEPKQNFDTQYFVGAVAAAAAFASLAIATRSKAQQINDQLVATTQQEIVDPETGLVSITEGEGEPMQTITFVTAGDERVCPDCEELDGMEWDVNDSGIEEPPIHDNCRCFLELSD